MRSLCLREGCPPSILLLKDYVKENFTLGMIVLIRDDCSSLLGLTSKERIRLELNLSRLISWNLSNCCFRIVDKGLICGCLDCLSCKDRLNFELFPRHSEAKDQLEQEQKVHRGNPGEDCWRTCMCRDSYQGFLYKREHFWWWCPPSNVQQNWFWLKNRTQQFWRSC